MEHSGVLEFTPQEALFSEDSAHIQLRIYKYESNENMGSIWNQTKSLF